MALLDDIGVARSLVQDRANTLAEGITKNDTRYSYDNADQADSWQGRWLGGDRERLNQLDLLSQAVSDPAWTQNLENEASARKVAGDTQADADYRKAEDQRRVTAARSGTAAGANDAAVAEENRQRVAAIKVQVSQQVAEFKSAGIQNLEEMGQQLLSKALAGGDETGAMGVASAGSADASRTSALAGRTADDYRNLLSNTVGGFLSGTVTPAITSGFQAADRWNEAQRDNYYDARNQGSYTGTFQDWANANGGTRSWWGY